MRNASWADLMEEEEATKLESHSQLKKAEEITTLKTQSIESDCVVLSSDEKDSSSAVAIEQSNMKWHKVNPLEKKRRTKSR